MVVSVRRRIAGIAGAGPDRAALVGFGADLAEQVLSWREFAGRVADAAGALRAALDRRARSCAVVPAGNTVPAAIAIAAALAAGVPVFPLNPATPPAERDALLRLLGRRFAHGYRDGYLYLEPRDHDTINVGGEKVDPEEVEAALRDHPAVADAVAVAVPHPTLGSVVGAQIVLHPGASVRRADLAAHCGRRLAGYKIPKQFTFVDQVPRSAAGKVQRWRLAPPHQNAATPP